MSDYPRAGTLLYRCTRCGNASLSGLHVPDLWLALSIIADDELADEWPAAWGMPRPSRSALHRCPETPGAVGLCELVGGDYDGPAGGTSDG
jgi:hypothetical protein